MNDNLTIDQKLNQCLGPEWTSRRTAFGGGTVMYIEGSTAINLANELFGYNGWSSEIKQSVVDVSDDGRVTLGMATTVRVTLKDGTFHEDIGYGTAENAKSKAAAYEKARKQSVTDGLKRTLRQFGNAMGNCIYDKTYCRNIANMGRPTVSRRWRG
ncbi:DNA repair protein Rad52/59/22 [Chlamydoabsidia padenii]|nr:DNA repair protein Rad52/59/22 [Chlamydoabsidia padenii]